MGVVHGKFLWIEIDNSSVLKFENVSYNLQPDTGRVIMIPLVLHIYLTFQNVTHSFLYKNFMLVTKWMLMFGKHRRISGNRSSVIISRQLVAH